MNTQLLKVKKHRLISFAWKAPLLTMTTDKNSIGVRQLILVSRILFSLITIGFIGYTVDRFIHSLQNTSS